MPKQRTFSVEEVSKLSCTVECLVCGGTPKDTGKRIPLNECKLLDTQDGVASDYYDENHEVRVYCCGCNSREEKRIVNRQDIAKSHGGVFVLEKK